MYTIMGVTGQVGGAVARRLLAEGHRVRAVMRDERKADEWRARGAEVALADYRDAEALETAFAGSDGTFVMLPPLFYPEAGFPETHAFARAIGTALLAAGVPKFVALSSVGAHRDRGLGIIESLHIFERELGRLQMPGAFLRAAWIMENALWDIAPARERGAIAHSLYPLDRKIPMISTADIGAIAAGTLRQQWNGTRYLELEGPAAYSPADLAAALASLLNRDVRAEAIPRAEWADAFIRLGAPEDRLSGRLAMLDGFISGWIDFERTGTESLKGEVTLEEALKKLV
ncbi:NmrA family NAD(P)-binding protein [Paenibacillus sp. GCM10023250]|uniref:NmrA family NAD(P)-binding protein n=1 Tax=Paenibacillus sp. GCM10023250 TaxID=3252648 RepID=UPI0036228ACE